MSAPESWGAAARDPRFRRHAILTLIFVAFAATVFSRFVVWVEARPGAILDDPVLALVGPHDLTVPAFALIYGALLLCIFTLGRSPDGTLLFLQVYFAMFLVRVVAMWTIPLDPPETIIRLTDPLTRALFGTAESPTRDLFFSGHTSTLFTCFLTAPSRRLAAVYAVGTVLIGAMMIVQHVHYTVDVLAAPFFVYGTYRGVLRLRSAWG